MGLLIFLIIWINNKSKTKKQNKERVLNLRDGWAYSLPGGEGGHFLFTGGWAYNWELLLYIYMQSTGFWMKLPDLDKFFSSFGRN